MVLLRLVVGQCVPLSAARSRIVEFIEAALIASLLVFCLVRPHIAQAYCIPTASMEPTLLPGDRVLVLKSLYWFREPRAGQIIVFRTPEDTEAGQPDLIKRVMAAGGDELKVDLDGVYRNGRKLSEPYAEGANGAVWPTTPGPLRVPHGYLVVFGDNREESSDSRKWVKELPAGFAVDAPFVPVSSVRGRACIVFWPPPRWRAL